MTGNQIGDDGANVTCELLKTNTSLNVLNTWSLEEIENNKAKTRHGNANGQIAGLEKKERSY